MPLVVNYNFMTFCSKTSAAGDVGVEKDAKWPLRDGRRSGGRAVLLYVEPKQRVFI